MELASRASYRGQVTKLVKAVTDYLNSESSSLSDNCDRDVIEEELIVLMDRLSAAHDSLRRANTEVKDLIKSEELVKEAEAVVEYEDKAIGAITRLKCRLSKIRMQQPISTNNVVQTPAEVTLPSAPPTSIVHLKKLQPRTFAGDFKKWVPFWEQFRVLVHENSSLSTIDKFNYLETALTGRAAEMLAGLTPSESNYNTAISLLKEEYGDRDKIVDHTMQRLLATKPVTSKTDTLALRQLYTSVLSSTRSLSALGIPSSSYYIMLKGILLRCLPNELRVDFHRYCDDSKQPSHSDNTEDAASVASVSDSSLNSPGQEQVSWLLRFLKREVESQEKANEAKSPSVRQHIGTKHTPIKTALGLFAAEKEKREEACIFCKQTNHNSTECCDGKTLIEKKQLLKAEKRCYRCCRKGHNSKNCRIKGIVCRTCRGRHATSLCDPSYSTTKGDSGSKEHKSSNVSTSTAQLYTAETAQVSVYLQTACAYVSGERSSLSLYIRLVLDGGSQLSFIKTSVARKLNLPIVGKHDLSIIPFGSCAPKPTNRYNKVRVELRGQYSNNAIILEAVEVPEICFDVLTVPDKVTKELSGLRLADARIDGQHIEEGISILIGADSYWKFVTDEHKRLTDCLMAINTVLGWTLQGPVNQRGLQHPSVASLYVSGCQNQDGFLNEDVKQMWQLDTLGILPDAKHVVSNKFALHIRRKGKRFEACLPWKDQNSLLNDNRGGALACMQSLIRKLTRSGKLIEYDLAMREMLSNNIAEISPSSVSNEGRVYYMPHHPVYRSDKETTKLRIVFNASAHAPNYQSLNDLLEVGTNLLPDLLTILLKFRIGRIGVIADIEKAFLQILLQESDRDSHRFYWFSEKINPDRLLPALQTYRMTRLTFGVVSSPYILNAMIQELINEAESNAMKSDNQYNRIAEYKSICELLRSSFYMDDLIFSVNEEKKAKGVYQEASRIFSSAGMSLRKWNTNNFEVKRYLQSQIEISPNNDNTKVLGLRWTISTDELEVDLNAIIELCNAASPQGTKRDVLRLMSKIFDPIGILLPWTVRLKILFQNIWKTKIEWDEMLPTDLQKVWISCRQELKQLHGITIARHLKIKCDSTELHVFADSSQSAYGVVAYARTDHGNGEISTELICAKGRIAPLKLNQQDDLTIPKLELTAALIAARLVAFLQNNLPIKFSDVFIWTDSQIALQWITGTQRRWKPFVENRVKEIRSLSRLTSWHHCPGTDNPADLLTRGIKADAFQHLPIWFEGPPWLRMESGRWPKLKMNNTSSICVLNLTAEREEDLIIENELKSNGIPELKAEKFASWTKLLRITAYVLRAVKAFNSRSRLSEQLEAKDMNLAETYWIHMVQLRHFSNETVALRQNKGIPSTSKLTFLSPILDADGLLRVGGRLQHLTLNLNEVHPIILPKSSYVTKLIVRDAHEKTFHSGASAVLTRLRTKYWIIRGRQLVKSVIKDCFVCKSLRGKPAHQPFAPLPKDRVFQARPFEVTGIDFAGPLFVVNDRGERQKAYILLFTCAAIRAVHLECTKDLTTDSCLQALRRFIARRGAPRIIYSDNATTFKRASLELKQLTKLKQDIRFVSFLGNARIHWKFIVERAPWWGGFWERLVGVVKSALRAAIMKAVLNIDQLHTLITEVEAVVNSRPLTYVGDDPLDLTPLTPLDFLNGGIKNNVEGEINGETTGKDLRIHWKQRLRFLGAFKRRWYKEYLLQLKSLHHGKKVLSSNLRVGDVVLLEDSSLPRTLWRLAVIENLYPGRDNKVRACEVRLANGTHLRRPVQRLYPLELRD